MRVCIIQPVMKRYRVQFFLDLHEVLAREGVDLEIVYGTPWPEEAKRGDHDELAFPVGRKVRTFRWFRKLFIQPVFFSWLRADLVVVEHANKHALNYLLMALDGVGLKRVAFWGHGHDRQSDAASLGEIFKRKTLHWATWWFAYTRGAHDYVAAQGFDVGRITVVENAIDTRALRAQLAVVSGEDIEKTRRSFGWEANARIGVFCGSLYANKKLDLLFASAQLIHDLNPHFRLLILGGGPLADAVGEFAAGREWVRCLGPVFDREKAVLLKMAELWLNPGLVGLGVLDGFCAGLPVLTTHQSFHSPEIEYLEDGVNGLMLTPDATSYATAVLDLLSDDMRLARFRQGAIESAERYNIEAMVNNFANGVRKCLRLS
jgi:L-malate glycosyltransferase